VVSSARQNIGVKRLLLILMSAARNK